MKYLRVVFFKNDRFEKVRIEPIESYEPEELERFVNRFRDSTEIYKCNEHGNNYSRKGKLIAKEGRLVI